MFSEVVPPRSSTAPWWSVAFRGVLAVIFGVILLSNPAIGALALVVTFGVYAALDGIAALSVATNLGRAGERWGWWLVEGLVGLAIAVLAFSRPHATLVAIVLLIAIRAFAIGVVEIGGAAKWHEVEHRWLLALAGVLSVLFGILLIAEPIAAGFALVWAIGAYSIVSGIVLATAGLRALAARRAIAGREHAT